MFLVDESLNSHQGTVTGAVCCNEQVPLGGGPQLRGDEVCPLGMPRWPRSGKRKGGDSFWRQTCCGSRFVHHIDMSGVHVWRNGDVDGHGEPSSEEHGLNDKAAASIVLVFHVVFFIIVVTVVVKAVPVRPFVFRLLSFLALLFAFLFAFIIV